MYHPLRLLPWLVSERPQTDALAGEVCGPFAFQASPLSAASDSPGSDTGTTKSSTASKVFRNLSRWPCVQPAPPFGSDPKSPLIAEGIVPF